MMGRTHGQTMPLERARSGRDAGEALRRGPNRGRARGDASRTLLLVLLGVSLAVAAAFYVTTREPGVEPEDGASPPIAAAPEARGEAPAASDPGDEGEVESAEAVPELGKQSIAVWETREGTIHLGDDPPPESHELGQVTVGDARALAAARPETTGATGSPSDLEELRRRIREDTRSRPIADDSGLPTWSERDIRGIVAVGDRLDVSTDWITNPVMIRVARGLCRYLSAQGDTFDASTVVVRGRHSRILARCKAWS